MLQFLFCKKTNINARLEINLLNWIVPLKDLQGFIHKTVL